MFAPVDAASVVVFRVLFGALVAFSAGRFLAKGWVETLYLDPAHHLTYPWFTWVRPLPAPLMYGAVAAMIPLGLAIAAGRRTRLAAAACLALFGYCELIDAALYLNHYWFVTLVLVLLTVLPTSGPSLPAVVVWLLRLQIAVVYVMAGLAKLNVDWLVRSQPMGMWLASRTDTPVVGWLFDEPGIGRIASWLGVVFDLTIVGWLLWRRTRLAAWVAVVAFHVLTWRLFAIGVFPWVMIAATTVFFDPGWPRAIELRWNPVIDNAGRDLSRASRRIPPRSGLLLGAAAAWTLLQIVVPLRHLADDGDVRWTEEGYYGSFRVMLTEKTGLLTFHVVDPATGETWTVSPSFVLTDWQARQAAVRADLTLAAAHLVAGDFERLGHHGVEVRADSWVSFNGRRRQRMIDPTVDLAALDRRASAAAYVLPLVPAVRE